MARPPNILWIVTTQWRGQALGCAGDPNARTPQLDRLAARGRHYANAFTPHPFGPFARAALLTGRPSPANGVREYFDPLPGDARTIAHELNERGYRTGFFGKWHLGRRDADAPLVGEMHARTIVPPDGRGGFAHWEGFESGFMLNDPWLHGTGQEEPRQHRGYQSDVLATRAAEWCRAAATTPWFCVVSLEPPHPPYAAPSAGLVPPAPADLRLRPNIPRAGPVEDRARTELAGYYAHIEATDRAIGGLVAALDGTTTIVVFTSVHGDMHGAHGVFRKGWPYEESVRVPLIVADLSPEGRQDLLPAADGLPGLLDLSSWATAWAERRPAPTPHDWCVLSMPSVVKLPLQCDRTWRAVRTARHKLVLNADGSPWLCFDLERDPFEECNLAERSERDPELRRLRALIPETPG